jgi:hypothetical protein
MNYKIYYFTKDDLEPIVYIVPNTQVHTDTFQKTYISYEKEGFSVTEIKKAVKDIKQPHPLTGEAV